GGAVAAMRGAGALDLDRVLAGFRQEARVRSAVDPGAGLVEAVEDPRRGGCRVDLHKRSRGGKHLQRRPEPLGRFDRDSVTEMAVEAGGEFAAVDEEGDA